MAKDDNSGCTFKNSGSMVVVAENKRRAAFRNKNNDEFHVTQIDNCLVTEGIKVDFLVRKAGVASVFVELKGSDVDHACDQLEASAEHPVIKPLLEKRLGFIVVCSRYPKIDTKVQRAKIRIAKRFKAILHVVCDQGEFDIEQIAGKPL